MFSKTLNVLKFDLSVRVPSNFLKLNSMFSNVLETNIVILAVYIGIDRVRNYTFFHRPTTSRRSGTEAQTTNVCVRHKFSFGRVRLSGRVEASVWQIGHRAGSNYTKSLQTSITITITLKYQLQLQLHHHNVVLNYNYTMLITITAPFFLHKLHFYLWNCGLIGFGCFPCLACCLVPTQPRNALRLHNIATSDSISCVGQLN